MKSLKNHKDISLYIILLSVFIFYGLWSLLQPSMCGPDEPMHYDIVKYIAKHLTIPDGRDPEIRDYLWGISYAFNPITPYIIMGYLVRILSIFTDSIDIFIHGARFINVIFGTLTAYYVYKAGKLLFKGNAPILFTIAIMFWPGHIFLHCYINTDSMAMLSTSMIVYSWALALKHDWDKKSLYYIAISISICFLSYYNAYGFILSTFILYLLTRIKKNTDWKAFFLDGFFILFIVFLLTGWWFIRNAILYNGDILGMRTSSLYSSLYAVEELKPENRMTMKAMGYSFMDVPKFLHPAFLFPWYEMLIKGFIGLFDWYKIYLPDYIYRFFKVFSATGIAFFLLNILCIIKDRRYPKMKTFSLNISMFISLSIPPMLTWYYSYANDFQPQGRYIMPSLIPLIFFAVKGYESLIYRFIKNKKLVDLIFLVLGLLLIVYSFISFYYGIILPYYCKDYVFRVWPS